VALLLNIDTATEYASVCLSNDETVLSTAYNNEQKEHASFIQPAIEKIYASANLSLKDTDAIAVSAGPGSYTGLRVGLATAKGICFALHKPLLLINTLQVMAHASVKNYAAEKNLSLPLLFCPMIDARRMEVYTALYNSNLDAIIAPAAKILDGHSFAQELANNTIIFSGSGAAKFKNIVHHPHAVFFSNKNIVPQICVFFHFFILFKKSFADLAYSEPFLS